jgi:hypothetical protein
MEHVRQEPRQQPGSRSHAMENVTQRPQIRVAKRRRTLLAMLALGAVVAAGTVTWLLLRGGEGTSEPAAQPATIVSEAQLARVAAQVDHPVYWAGPLVGYSYELTTTSNGRIYVRYLPQGVSAGDPRPNFLVVGTYTQKGSYEALKRAAKAGGGVTTGIDGGGIALFSSQAPTSVYFSYPDANYQVEVYNPVADHARKLVEGGKIKPIR